MKRLISFSLASLLLVALAAISAPPPGYYSAADGKTGPVLRAALHSIIRNHHSFPYSSSSSFDTSDALKVLDEDPANTNNVILLYEQRSEPKSTFGLTTGWNREHQWCDSYGLDGREPSYTDLHNLRAEDANVNSSRGNKFYDVSDPASPGYRNPAHAEAPLCSTDSDSWEPPAAVKGNIARALFYMAVRYTGDVTNEPALILTDQTALITSTNAFMGRLSTLLKWAAADPVDAAEQLRNDRVYSLYQTNRNPFVDHPEWVNLAFAPKLNIALDPATSTLQISWSADYTGAQLESSPGATPATWTTITNSPVLTNSTWQTSIPLAASPLLFRLHLN